MEKVSLTDQEWKRKLTAEQYQVLRKAATEPPFTGTYVHVKDKGVYRCAGCGADLFRSDAKFDSGTGWPSFYEPVSEGALEFRRDWSMVVPRTEVRCAAWRASGSRVRRRPAADGPALLHELLRARPGQVSDQLTSGPVNRGTCGAATCAEAA